MRTVELDLNDATEDEREREGADPEFSDDDLGGRLPKTCAHAAWAAAFERVTLAGVVVDGLLIVNGVLDVEGTRGWWLWKRMGG